MLRSPSGFASGFAPALGDQLVHQAASARRDPKLLSHSSQELASGLEHDALTVVVNRELIALLDPEAVAQLRREDEAALRSNS